jgi:hypothetical protein
MVWRPVVLYVQSLKNDPEIPLLEIYVKEIMGQMKSRAYCYVIYHWEKK